MGANICIRRRLMGWREKKTFFLISSNASSVKCITASYYFALFLSYLLSRWLPGVRCRTSPAGGFQSCSTSCQSGPWGSIPSDGGRPRSHSGSDPAHARWDHHLHHYQNHCPGIPTPVHADDIGDDDCCWETLTSSVFVSCSSSEDSLDYESGSRHICHSQRLGKKCKKENDRSSPAVLIRSRDCRAQADWSSRLFLFSDWLHRSASSLGR